jgi:hypothetical protein
MEGAAVPQFLAPTARLGQLCGGEAQHIKQFSIAKS